MSSRGPAQNTELCSPVERLALRPKEAAKALGLSERKLRELLPELPHLRVGGAVLLPVEGLRAWLREHADSQDSRADKAVEEVLTAVGSQIKD